MPPAGNRTAATRTDPSPGLRRAFPGRPDQVPAARHFVADALRTCPACEDAVLVTSELVTNAIRHSASGRDASGRGDTGPDATGRDGSGPGGAGGGGTVWVAVTHRAGGILLEVADQGGPWLADAGGDGLSGHGLVIVGGVARAWGVTGDGSGRVVWAELACPAAQSPDAMAALTDALCGAHRVPPASDSAATPPHHQSSQPVAGYDDAITECAGDNRMPGPEDHVIDTDRPRETPIARENLQERLENLPRGHPSSPFRDDGTRKPPPPDPRPHELPLPDELTDQHPPPPDSNSLPDDTGDQKWTEHVREVRESLDAARAQGLATHELHTIEPDGDVWSKDRRAEQHSIVDALYARASNVPNDRQAIIAGGLPGAGKSTILESHAGIENSQFLTIDPDQVKEELARRNLIPRVEGLSPMEGSDLVHRESSYIAMRLAERARRDGKNLIWDISMSSEASTGQRIDSLREAGYSNVEGVFVHIPVETSIQRADTRHRAGHEEYREGRGYGGRYMPSELISAQADSDWGSTNRRNFEALKSRFDRWSLYDNSIDGAAPKLIQSDSRERGSHDQRDQ
jgi:predicted ABC-type ATPase